MKRETMKTSAITSIIICLVYAMARILAQAQVQTYQRNDSFPEIRRLPYSSTEIEVRKFEDGRNTCYVLLLYEKASLSCVVRDSK